MNIKRIIIAFIIPLFGCKEPIFVNITDKVHGVKIQPNEALEIAKPYLEQHGTYNWNQEKKLETYITLKGKWYYIMKTNYPAKSIYFYLQPAVKVQTNTGEVKL